MVEEVGEHFAAGEGGKEVVLVTFYDGGVFVPELVTVEEDVVDHVSVATVRTCSVIAGIHLKAR